MEPSVPADDANRHDLLAARRRLARASRNLRVGRADMTTPVMPLPTGLWRRVGPAEVVDDFDAPLRRPLRRPPLGLRWASRIEAWPPALWLSLQLAALWPVGLWAARRMSDGSDQPMGVVALALLAFALATGRLACHWQARLPWLVAATLATVLSTAFIGVLRVNARRSDFCAVTTT
jgi:hypothetical protein